MASKTSLLEPEVFSATVCSSVQLMTTSISTKIFDVIEGRTFAGVGVKHVVLSSLPSSELLCDHLDLHKRANWCFKQVVCERDLTFKQELKS